MPAMASSPLSRRRAGGGERQRERFCGRTASRGGRRATGEIDRTATRHAQGGGRTRDDGPRGAPSMTSHRSSALECFSTSDILIPFTSTGAVSSSAAAFGGIVASVRGRCARASKSPGRSRVEALAATDFARFERTERGSKRVNDRYSCMMHSEKQVEFVRSSPAAAASLVLKHLRRERGVVRPRAGTSVARAATRRDAEGAGGRRQTRGSRRRRLRRPPRP